MKDKIHPKLKEVVFKDISCEFSYKTLSSMDSKESIEWEDGKTYPMVKADISSASHPFYTGQQRLVDTEGRAEKFHKKYGKRLSKK